LIYLLIALFILFLAKLMAPILRKHNYDRLINYTQTST